MRKITRQIVWLFAVFVIYFGYSAFIDSVALYHNNVLMEIFDSTDNKVLELTSGTIMGTGLWNNAKIFWSEQKGFYLLEGYTAAINGVRGIVDLNPYIGGFMAPNSLLYTILTPFKLVLVGGVFAMLVPLTKSVFFGTVMGIKNYVKTRQGNLLFNYQKTINFATNFQEKLKTADNEQIKAEFAAYNGLAFKPVFLNNMMNSISNVLIKEGSVTPYIKPCGVVIDSLQEMYNKERQAAINGHPEEMFFDFKMGYDYTSAGSKYSVSYYKALETRTNTSKQLAWKMFSLEMFRFYTAMLAAIIPTIFVNIILLPLIGLASDTNSSVVSFSAPLLIVLFFIFFSILFHALLTFTKKGYKNWRGKMLTPALVYYGLLVVLALTLAFGINGIKAVGSIVSQGTATDKMWPFFAALGYTVLSSCLIMYVICTIMDANKSVHGMTKKIFIDGIILPSVAWFLATIFNFIGIIFTNLDMGLFSGISFAIVVVFWLYLSLSSFLLNNIFFPSLKKQKEIHERLAREGLASKKKTRPDPTADHSEDH